MKDSTKSTLPLFERWPALAQAVPWIPIGDWPTPVSAAPNFAAAHQLSAFYIKHENKSHPIAGGNKVRGLEFILAQAKSLGAGTLVTMGAAGSYHVCRTAFHAAALGLRTAAVIVPQPVADYVRRNLEFGQTCGAEFIPASFVSAGPRLVQAMLKPSYWKKLRPPYFIPPGGSASRACVGSVNAAFELRAQIVKGLLPEPEYLFVAMGSLGTAAGLLLGCRLAGLLTRIVGVAVSYPWYCTAGRCARMAARTLRFVRRFDSSIPEQEFGRSDLDVVWDVIGPGYAAFTAESLQLARQLHDTDGVALDGTYTAKTLHGAVKYIRRHGLQDRTHLFWNSYQPTIEVENVAGQRVHVELRRYFSEPSQDLDKLVPY